MAVPCYFCAIQSSSGTNAIKQLSRVVPGNRAWRSSTQQTHPKFEVLLTQKMLAALSVLPVYYLPVRQKER